MHDTARPERGVESAVHGRACDARGGRALRDGDRAIVAEHDEVGRHRALSPRRRGRRTRPGVPNVVSSAPGAPRTTALSGTVTVRSCVLAVIVRSSAPWAAAGGTVICSSAEVALATTSTFVAVMPSRRPAVTEMFAGGRSTPEPALHHERDLRRVALHEPRARRNVRPESRGVGLPPTGRSPPSSCPPSSVSGGVASAQPKPLHAVTPTNPTTSNQ